jgi:outer membrane protein
MAGPGVTRLKPVLLLCGLWVAAPPARGDSVAQALTNSYQTHRGLRAAQAQAVAAREGIVQSQAAQLPSLQVFGYGGYYNDYSLDEEPFGLGPLPDESLYGVYRWGLSLELPLYKGGAIRAGIRKAQADADAQEEAVALVRQNLLLNAATAYLDLFKARADLAVLQTSIQAYKVQKEAVASLLARQDATVVDLDQTISKLEDTQAQAYEAHIQEAKAVADYRRWIGEDPGGLIQPDPPKSLPESREAAIRLALDANPAVRQAVQSRQSAAAAVDIARAADKPALALVAKYSDELDRYGGDQGREQDYSIVLQLKVPFDLGGAVAAQVATARETHGQSHLQLSLTRDQVMQAAANAWDARVTAQADLQSRQVQAQSAQQALEGLLREQQRGMRTVLDTLNGRQELLKALLASNQAKHDLRLAEYQLLAALGRLNEILEITPGHLDQ